MPRAHLLQFAPSITRQQLPVAHLTPAEHRSIGIRRGGHPVRSASTRPAPCSPRPACRSLSSAGTSSAMTKQKIVIRLGTASEKCRSKAMVLAAKADGVSKMGITGDGKDQLEVEGDGIDTVCLVNCLRKKVGHADIVKVEEVKPEEKKPEEKKLEVVPLPYCWYPNYYYHYYP